MSRNIGDLVWVATTTHDAIEETCPDCLGTGRWHVVLPCGEEFDCECARCYHGGYEPSTGKVKENYDVRGMVELAVITGMSINGNQLEYNTTRGSGKKESDLHGTAESAKAQADQLVKEWLEYEHKTMQAQAKSRGRPRKNKDGEREANPMEFGGGAINYSKRCVRDSIKEALRWVDFAGSKGAVIDAPKMLADAIAKRDKKE